MTIAVNPKDAKPVGVPGLPRPQGPAHVIGSEREAIEVAEALAKGFAASASERDRTRAKPVAELDAFSQSGLWSINVPKAFGGPDVSYAVLAKVIEIISTADPSIGQIPQNHLGVVAAIRTVSELRQQGELFAEVLKGVRFGNAFSEFRSKRAADFETTFVDKGDHVLVTGEKFYSTGALFAHLVPIVALDEQSRAWYAIADRDAPGLTVLDDWSSFGQRATFSGTTLIDNVRVPKSHLVPGYKGYDRPTADGAISRSSRRPSTPASPGMRSRTPSRWCAARRVLGSTVRPRERRTIPIRFRPWAISFSACTPPRRCSKSPVARWTARWRIPPKDRSPRRRLPLPKRKC
jgi:Acyl-CoA dehydrogenase, N-terminal domain